MATERGSETRHHILAAAEECFASQGYDATAVAEICRHAGVTKGGFYHHFPSKQALFLELLERWLTMLDEELGRLRQGAGSAPEAFLAMADVIGPVFREAQPRLQLFLEFWAQASRDPTVWKAAVEPYRRYRALFAGLVEAGIAEGSLRRFDADAAAGAMVSLAVGLVMQGLMDPEGADWGAVVRETVRFVVRCLEKEPCGA